MDIFIASDGRKFMSQKSRDKHEIKLFAKRNFTYIVLEDTKEIQPMIYVKDLDCWNSFIDYLVTTYSFNYEAYRDKFSKFKNMYVIVCVGSMILKTTKEYIKELETKKKALQAYINKLKTNNFTDIDNDDEGDDQ